MSFAKDFNEPQCFVGLGYLNGAHAPWLASPLRDTFTMAHNVLKAHGQAVRMLRQYGKRPLEIGYASSSSNEAAHCGRTAAGLIRRKNAPIDPPGIVPRRIPRYEDLHPTLRRSAAGTGTRRTTRL